MSLNQSIVNETAMPLLARTGVTASPAMVCGGATGVVVTIDVTAMTGTALDIFIRAVNQAGSIHFPYGGGVTSLLTITAPGQYVLCVGNVPTVGQQSFSAILAAVIDCVSITTGGAITYSIFFTFK